ncbi:MAG TPA: hypothetical protein VMA13_08230 [Candidatus Saccharimonadales bacterium]|nr:hypothetical protein [Candidatus Saccharimonadales bacterium]
MNSFWSGLYDWTKDRRYAALFFVTLVGFFGLIILGVVLGMCTGLLDTPEGLVAMSFGAGVFILALIWKAIRRLQSQRRDASTFSRLSRDELTKARSKLMKGRKFKRL